jgi:ABC-2 type transport system permease protein
VSSELQTSGPDGSPRAARSLQLTWLVARREIRLRAKTRVFMVTTVIMLIAIALAVSLPAILSGTSGPARIGVVSGNATTSGIVAEAGRLSGTQAVAVPEPSLAAAEAALRGGDLSAVLVPGKEVIVKQVPLGGVSSGIETLARLSALSKLIQTVPGAAAAIATGALPVHGLEVPSKPLSSRLTGLFTVVIVWVLISVYGSQIALGIGEEKSSRVVEVLLSAVRPVQLLIGKVLGIGLLALGQAAAMVAVFIVAGFASGSSLVHGATLGVVIAGGVFIVLGYAFYCTAFAAAGSLVSRQSDVNSTIMPVQLPLIVAYALSYTVIYANGANVFYRVLGFLPPTAPIAMPVLYASGDVPVWQVVLSAVVCAAGTVWMARLAVRIYANSILRTGPRIRLSQAVRESRNATLPASDRVGDPGAHRRRDRRPRQGAGLGRRGLHRAIDLKAMVGLTVVMRCLLGTIFAWPNGDNGSFSADGDFYPF